MFVYRTLWMKICHIWFKTRALSQVRSGHIYMKDVHSAESNEKSYFRFLFFELWLIVFTIYGDTSAPPTKKQSCSNATTTEYFYFQNSATIPVLNKQNAENSKPII